LAGTFLDGIPEGVVLGVERAAPRRAPGPRTVAAYFLANILEALSSSAGMRRAGRSARYVFGVWIGIALIIGLAAGATGLVLRGTGPAVRGTLEAFAAGVILALVSQTMIPEAFHGSPQFNGLLLGVGFVALPILLVLSH
jgi:ZIP family zinc transporter